MTNKYQDLLIEWCDALVRAQITDEKEECYGGFRCESCDSTHGRADNAIYPLVTAYSLTGKEMYLSAAKRLLLFRQKLTQPSGSVRNDFTSPWEGITVFSAIGLLKTLIYYGETLPADFRREIEFAAKDSVRWVHEKMVVGFPAYINYYCAASLANALAYIHYHDEAYEARARDLLSYCMGLFTENGLLAGEGKPHDDRSPKGCLPIDVGYIAEESLPCLVHAADLLKDEKTFSSLAESARKLLDFMLPDGGWDNSFGVRNNKWTYYGSRTSDGCIGAFTELAKCDPIFREAAERTYEILSKCTHDGRLYGGPAYHENGQKPCIHHTFCHAAALADAIRAGIEEPRARMTLPAEKAGVWYKHYPEINSYKIHAGNYLATLSAYDYATHHFSNGAAHAGGGMLSLLYKEGVGPLVAGSVYEYKLTEPNNMQSPTGEVTHASLLVRAEYEIDGVKYATCLDRNPILFISKSKGGDEIIVIVKAHFRSVDDRAKDINDVAAFSYLFDASGLTIRVINLPNDARFILPIVRGAGSIITENVYEKRPIFFLTGGFAADEYTFSSGEDLTIKIV
ncbi:MAG: hypothetical protein J6U39_04175 [Clostridia bacterium]|nr:hypothetical protein [Clostridia bacterium]